MSMARIAVFFLRLASLGGILFTGPLIAFPLLMPEEVPGGAVGSFSPGCFAVFFVIVFILLSLVPAFIAWVIYERNVRPRQAAEKCWREGALSREERLGIWIRYVANLQIRHRSLRNTRDDPVPLVLQMEVPRALSELDCNRRARLLRFLQEANLTDSQGMINFSTDYNTADDGLEMRLPRRGLVSLAAAAFALLSGLFLLWAGLMVVSFYFANPLKVVGVIDGRLAELLPALCALLIPALLCGLTSAGLRRLYREAMLSLEESEHDRELAQRIALKNIQEQVNGLERSVEMSDREEESLAKKIIRAMVTVTASELDGLWRAELVKLLYESGWLRGESALSMDGSDLRATELRGANLSKAHLSGADLSGADLSGAQILGGPISVDVICAGAIYDRPNSQTQIFTVRISATLVFRRLISKELICAQSFSTMPISGEPI